MTVREFDKFLSLIKAGNNRGLGRIFDCYYDNLVKSGNFYSLDPETSEQVASTVLLGILRNAESCGGKDPDVVIYTAFRQAAENALARLKAGSDVGEKPTDGFDCGSRRETADLYYVCGLKIRKIAKILGVAAKAVKREIEALKKFFKNFQKK